MLKQFSQLKSSCSLHNPFAFTLSRFSHIKDSGVRLDNLINKLSHGKGELLVFPLLHGEVRMANNVDITDSEESGD